MSDQHLMSTYQRLPVAFDRGEGVWLYDLEGKRYLDALAGIAVNTLGHSHPAVTAAITEQASRLLHTSNLFRVPAQEHLADRLCGASGMDRVFFCSSGAEANEAAIKLARLHGHQRDMEKPAIVVFDGAFHGRTLATLSATANRKVQAGFEPLVSGFVRCPWNDVGALQAIADSRPDVVAVLVEPIQGEGGVRVPDENYLAELRRICDAQDWLLMCDEIQTGMARTGSLFASQQAGIQADVISVAKGLGNGIPIGACLARGKAAEVFGAGSHGSTFGGNPFACHVAASVLDVIESERLGTHAQQIGQSLRDALAQRLGESPLLAEIRGSGLMTGIELTVDCGALVRSALDDGLIINVTAGRVIRLLPPLILQQAEAEQIADQIGKLVDQFAATLPA